MKIAQFLGRKFIKNADETCEKKGFAESFYGKDILMTIYTFFLGVDIYCKKIYNK